MIRRVGTALGLAAMWVALWGDLGPGTVVAGLLAGTAVTVLVPRPANDRQLTLHPLGAIRFAVTFVGMLIASTWQVAMLVLSPGARQARGVLIVIELSERAYDVRTLIAHSISLTPGTLTVDVAADGRTLSVHVMEATRVPEARRSIRELEARAIGAFAPSRRADAPNEGKIT